MQTYQTRRQQADFETSPLEAAGPALDAENSVALEGVGEGTARAQTGFPCEGPNWYPQGCDGLDEMMQDLHLTTETARIPNQDIVYEQLAHTFAYGGGDPALLREWGYVIDAERSVPPGASADGFSMTVFRPAPELLAHPARRRRIEAMHGRRIVPVVAFRGTDTDPTGGLFGNVAADTDPAGVGAHLFAAHHFQIDATLARCGTPDVVGHSLGGALAQLAACRLGGVRRIVTFQAPGISAEDAALLDEKVRSTHYRVEGDAVPTAGEALTDGTVETFELAGLDTLDAHLKFPLAELARMRGAVPGLEGDGRHDIVDVRTETSEEAAPNESCERIRCSVGELLRLGVGVVTGAITPPLAMALGATQAALLTFGIFEALRDGVHHDLGLDSEGVHEAIEGVLAASGMAPEAAHERANEVVDALRTSVVLAVARPVIAGLFAGQAVASAGANDRSALGHA